MRAARSERICVVMVSSRHVREDELASISDAPPPRPPRRHRVPPPPPPPIADRRHHLHRHVAATAAATAEFATAAAMTETGMTTVEVVPATAPIDVVEATALLRTLRSCLRAVAAAGTICQPPGRASCRDGRPPGRLSPPGTRILAGAVADRACRRVASDRTITARDDRPGRSEPGFSTCWPSRPRKSIR